jgi:AraC family transcriptional regulator, positive regulator of tynA and feaB
MIAVSSRIVPPRDRFEFWCDLINRQLALMRTERIGTTPFHGALQAQFVGELLFAKVTLCGSRSWRSRHEVAKTDDHFYAACMQTRGTAILEQGDERVVLRPGDMFVLDTLHAFAIGAEQAEQLVVKLPRRWIDSRVSRPDGLAGALLRDHPLSPLLGDLFVHGFNSADQLSPAAGTMLAQHTVELFAQTIEEHSCDNPTPTEAWREALFVRAGRLIALRCAEPGLTPDSIACSLGVSIRLLQRIFAERGTTVMGRVWEERVKQAARLLAMPDASHRSITEIAFACGFNDSAHFTRAFVARMATTPSHWRCEAHEHALDTGAAALINGGTKPSVPSTGTSVRLR